MLGFVSLLMDLSSEIIHSLLPIFMVTALGATALAAVLAGVLPAIRLSRVTLRAGMASEGRTTPNEGGQRITRALVAAQLALSLILVTASGLLLRTMIRIANVDPGFRPGHVVVFQVHDETPGSLRYPLQTAA